MNQHIYDIYGNKVIDNNRPVTFDSIMKGVAHRGFSLTAPENTIPAYKMAREKGMTYVETDVGFTSDNVPMLLHDDTIDRTSNGSGTLRNMTYEQVRQYDFGSWKSSIYAGTKIPTLQEFIEVCKALGLYPYVEVKNVPKYSEEQVISVVKQIYKGGLRGHVTFISFDYDYLSYIKEYDPSARLGYAPAAASINDITTCKSLETGKNEVFYDASYVQLTDAICNAFAEEMIPIEAWIINSEETILSLNNYVTGVTSDGLHAGEVLYNSVAN